jgi:hypothetical protein
MKRHRMGKKSNRRNFRRGNGVHKKNFAQPMRGGLRL